jgi:hypothetical protein
MELFERLASVGDFPNAITDMPGLLDESASSLVGLGVALLTESAPGAPKGEA